MIAEILPISSGDSCDDRSIISTDFQQEEGLMSSLPIGVNQVEIERGLPTSSTAVFVPFTTQEPVSYTHLDVYKRQSKVPAALRL